MCNKEKAVINIMNINPITTLITLNVNSLNTQSKR